MKTRDQFTAFKIYEYGARTRISLTALSVLLHDKNQEISEQLDFSSPQSIVKVVNYDEYDVVTPSVFRPRVTSHLVTFRPLKASRKYFFARIHSLVHLSFP